MRATMWMVALAAGLVAVQAGAGQAATPAPAASSKELKVVAPKPAPALDKTKVSYSIGVSVAKGIQMQGIDVDTNSLVKGIRDVLSGAKLTMSEADIQTTLTALSAQLRQKAMEAAHKLAGDNQKAGEAFLAKNKTQPGVVTLPSGLQYKILKAGTGAKPKADDTVECQYRGTLIDGKEFDSSYRRGQPATFKVNQVIPGWQEALQLMPVGSTWELFVPAKLAYGAQGAGQMIGPNATLIFEVELLGINGGGK